MSEKIMRGHGDMLIDDPCTRVSPKMSAVPGGPLAATRPPALMSSVLDSSHYPDGAVSSPASLTSHSRNALVIGSSAVASGPTR